MRMRKVEGAFGRPRKGYVMGNPHTQEELDTRTAERTSIPHARAIRAIILRKAPKRLLKESCIFEIPNKDGVWKVPWNNGRVLTVLGNGMVCERRGRPVYRL